MIPAELAVLDGVPYRVPSWLYSAWCATGYRTARDFPDCCGAGDGFGERLVPETILGLRVSPCCWIHDRTHQAAQPSWEAFFCSNDLFRENLTATIRYRSNNILLRWLREHRVTDYFLAVDTVGARIFRRLKAEQGHDVANLLSWDSLRQIRGSA